MNHTPLRVALSLSAAILLASPVLADSHDTPGALEEPPEFGLLKDAPGVETVFYTCTACHSERIIAQQGLTRDEWSELIDWMVEEQGMTMPDEVEMTEILDYLAAHYNTDRPNFPDHFPVVAGN